MTLSIDVRKPDWRPLEAVLPPEQCASFMYMGHAGEIVLYKHCHSRRYLNIDAKIGLFYRYKDGSYLPISRDRALREAQLTCD